MAKPNRQGDWDLTNDDVAEIAATNWPGAAGGRSGDPSVTDDVKTIDQIVEEYRRDPEFRREWDRMHMEAAAEWRNDGTADLSLRCSYDGCDWYTTWDGDSSTGAHAALADLSDAADAHLHDAHDTQPAGPLPAMTPWDEGKPGYIKVTRNPA